MKKKKIKWIKKTGCLFLIFGDNAICIAGQNLLKIVLKKSEYYKTAVSSLFFVKTFLLFLLRLTVLPAWSVSTPWLGTSLQRYQRGVAPADSWNWGKWGLKEYKRKGSFLSWFVPVREISVRLPWLLWSAPYKMFFPPRGTLFQCLYPHSPASWAGSRASSPVS